MRYTHTIRVRYADCDMQGVVYNSHYLTFVDDAFDCWLRELATDFEDAYGWEVMLKKAEITWDGPTRMAEHLDIVCEPTRWGNTSFDVSYTGAVDSRAVFSAVATYVTVDHENHRPVVIPDQLKEHIA